MIKAVLFDFDETLQDRTGAFEHYMDAFFAQYMPDLKGAQLEKRKDEMRLHDNGGYFDRAKLHEKLKEFWKWEDSPSPEELAERYVHTFCNFVQLYEGVPEVFKELKSLGYTVGVLTNGPAYLQKNKVKNAGLMPLIDFLLIGGEIGINKPDKRIFEIAAERLDIKCAECVYVGDHPVNDIEAALGAGMKAVRVNRGWFTGKDLRPDVPVIENIVQVTDVIEEMNK